MVKNDKKSKMTLEKLAITTHGEFLSMDKKIEDMRAELKDDIRVGTVEVLRAVDKKIEDMRAELKDDIRVGTVEVLRAVDKIVTRFDVAEKDHAAHGMLHKRITDDLHVHDVRIKKLEVPA